MIKAKPFSLDRIRLLDSPFKRAQSVNGEYLLQLEPERLLAGFYQSAGLAVVKPAYAGWEERGIAGHSLGHYLSGLALYVAATSSEAHRERLRFTLGELERCQEARGDGYIGGIPGAEEVWKQIRAGDIRSEGFDLNGLWVPWYNLHKTLAGLVDAYHFAELPQATPIARRFADWMIRLTAGLDDAQWQTMLRCEHGGMNESLADLYAITADAKYVELANRFHHDAILNPLKEGTDDLAGKHSNTQIPKVIGLAKLYELKGGEANRAACEYFWERIVRHRTYANGGNSNHEHLGPADKLRHQFSMQTSEICNTYNMLKLTKHLFSWEPKSELFDYAERALINHILASQKGAGEFTYFVPMCANATRPFSTPFDDFWCCVGTGMESHSKYAESVFFAGENELFVNLMVPCRLDWPGEELVVELQSNFPADSKASLTLKHAENKKFGVAIRIPAWCTEPILVTVNKKHVEATRHKDGYLRINRIWQSTDTIEWEYPRTLRFEPVPDDPNFGAVMFGPVLLAAQVEPGSGDPWFVMEDFDLSNALEPTGNPLEFRSKGAIQPNDLVFRPFWQFTEGNYSTYFGRCTPSEWAVRAAAIEAERKKQLEREAKTVDHLRIGEMQPERDHELTSHLSESGPNQERFWRHAQPGGWFEFSMKVKPDAANLLVLTWLTGDFGRDLKVSIDGEVVLQRAAQEVTEIKFIDEELAIPTRLTEGKSKIRVRIEGSERSLSPGLYGCRTVLA